MKPVNYTMKGQDVIFHYCFSDLRKFIERGKSHGDVGMLFTKANGKMHTFRGFGTIESPCKHIMTITLMHEPLFDGQFSPKTFMNRDILISQDSKMSYSMVILNFENSNKDDH